MKFLSCKLFGALLWTGSELEKEEIVTTTPTQEIWSHFCPYALCAFG